MVIRRQPARRMRWADEGFYNWRSYIRYVLWTMKPSLTRALFIAALLSRIHDSSAL